MRRFMSYFVVHRIIRPLCIYTKETIGQTSVGNVPIAEQRAFCRMVKMKEIAILGRPIQLQDS